MSNTPDPPPVLSGPGIPVPPLDWRTGGFVAVDRVAFPDRDPVAHRVVKWYASEAVTKVSGAWAAADMAIRPACQDDEDDSPHMEMTPLYAQSRGARWCQDPRCAQDGAE